MVLSVQKTWPSFYPLVIAISSVECVGGTKRPSFEGREASNCVREFLWKFYVGSEEVTDFQFSELILLPRKLVQNASKPPGPGTNSGGFGTI